MKHIIIVALTAICLASCSGIVDRPDIIPVPKEVEVSSGEFVFGRTVKIAYTSEDLAPSAQYLACDLETVAGCKTELSPVWRNDDILLALSDDNAPEGSYSLEVTAKEIRITGNGYSGVVNGIASLRQLVYEASFNFGDKNISIPACRIQDAPRFEWRGIMLDVARHFFTKDEVKQLLDVMAFYKMNRLHWHLTDDQGWRVEIRKYPALTEKGAWRHFNNHDRKCQALEKSEHSLNYRIPEERLIVHGRDTLYGGYYTQDDIREIVDYALVRGIEIIPEVDMPGHMLAAIGNYPWLACGRDLSWGKLFSCPICPGKDSVIDFCKDIYREIFSLFPCEYVHIGGDEVDYTNWKNCSACQKRMREHGLETPAELQSWFIHEMESFFNSNGKKLICWDEGISGGLSETATVMWWRSWSPEPVAKVASEGTEVIACPNATFYLDYAQDSKSMGNIYDFDKEASAMFGEDICNVIGVQGNLWTETTPSEQRMHHQIFPRLLAIAELGWSLPEVKSFAGFNDRIQSHFAILDKMGIAYRIPDLEGFYDVNSFVGSANLELSCQDKSARIFYTADGSIPDMNSAEYTVPIQVTETTEFTFRTFGTDGRQGDICRTQFRKEKYHPAVQAMGIQPGLSVEWYDYAGDICTGIESASFNGKYIVEDVMIPEGVKGNIGLIIKSLINIPETGIYTFRLFSDDGSLLTVDGALVVDNDGAHSPYEKIGQKALEKGLHPVELRYFDHNGGLLNLDVLSPDGEKLSYEGLWFAGK